MSWPSFTMSFTVVSSWTRFISFLTSMLFSRISQVAEANNIKALCDGIRQTENTWCLLSEVMTPFKKKLCRTFITLCWQSAESGLGSVQVVLEPPVTVQFLYEFLPCSWVSCPGLHLSASSDIYLSMSFMGRYMGLPVILPGGKTFWPTSSLMLLYFGAWEMSDKPLLHGQLCFCASLQMCFFF